jgi:hypothetical protein
MKNLLCVVKRIKVKNLKKCILTCNIFCKTWSCLHFQLLYFQVYTVEQSLRSAFTLVPRSWQINQNWSVQVHLHFNFLYTIYFSTGVIVIFINMRHCSVSLSRFPLAWWVQIVTRVKSCLIDRLRCNYKMHTQMETIRRSRQLPCWLYFCATLWHNNK